MGFDKKGRYSIMFPGLVFVVAGVFMTYQVASGAGTDKEFPIRWVGVAMFSIITFIGFLVVVVDLGLNFTFWRGARPRTRVVGAILAAIGSCWVIVLYSMGHNGLASFGIPGPLLGVLLILMTLVVPRGKD